MNVSREITLSTAAFGAEPGSWPLPTAATPHQRWLRAVAAGGQGHYAGAAGDLAALLRDAPGGPLAALACSTQGSFLRQLGWHALARGWDGRALALAGGHPEARVDALTGLAADALGVGRFAAAAALLHRADGALSDAALSGAVPPRLAVRRAWVAAELAMATGDGAAAVQYAEEAVTLAGATDSARHQAKSQVVLAAALCSAGTLDAARATADAALDATGRMRLVPLRWALACLLAEIGSLTRTAQQVGAVRDDCAELVSRRGGRWHAR